MFIRVSVRCQGEPLLAEAMQESIHLLVPNIVIIIGPPSICFFRDMLYIPCKETMLAALNAGALVLFQMP